MHRGYIKLWRKSLDSGIMGNAPLWMFWCWCLMKASHKKTKCMVGYQEVCLDAGQFIFGRHKAAKTLHLSEQTIKTCLNSLKATNNLTIKSTNKYSIITIVNWDSYQQADFEDNQQSNQQTHQPLTSNQPATNQQLTTYKNIKNNKNEKKEKTIGEILPEWLDKKLWNEFLKMRVSIKKPVRSEIAVKRLLTSLKKLLDDGYDQTEILGMAIEKCWQSFYAPNTNISKFPSRKPTGQDLHDELLEAKRRFMENESI